MKTYEEVLRGLCETDPRIVVMTAENRAAIRNLPPLLGDRFIDVGIAEQTMVGAAAGLAVSGRIPIVHALATFLTLRAFEFIRTDVGIANLPVKLVGGVPGFLSEANGPTHQAIEDIALLRGIPHMQVVCPTDAWELSEALPAIMNSGSPVYVRYNALKPQVAHTTPFEIGRAEVFGDGKDVALLTYGFLLGEVLEAQALLEKEGVRTRVLNLRSLKPIDEAALVSAASQCRLLATVEDHFLTGGLYSILAETLLTRGQSARVLPFALKERWFRPGLLPDVLTHEGFRGASIAKEVQKTLSR